jgi:nucleoside-diphosphate-sugar epimerase
MTVAITGVNGFIGQTLATLLVAQGHRVLGLSRRGTLLPGVENRRTGDHLNVDNLTDTLTKAMAGANTVVHLAAKAHQTDAALLQDDGQFDVNLQLTEALLTACKRVGVQRLVYVSSIGVNGQRTTGRAFTEQDAPAPVEAYARSKWRCEQRVQAFGAENGLPWVVLRPPLVYGPQAPGNFGRLIRALNQGWPLPLAAVHNRRHFIGIDNLVDAIALCLTHPAAANQTYVLADNEATSTPDLLRLAAQAMQRPARLWPVPVPLLRWAARLAGQTQAIDRLCDSLEVDNTTLRQQTGWRPPLTLAEGVARAVQNGSQK